MRLTTIDLHNQELIKSWKFPGGEIGVRLTEDCLKLADEPILLFARINSSDDLMKLLMTNEAMGSFERVEVYIPYLPYARQDRACSKGDSFSLKVLCELLDTCSFNKIHTFDLHSDVAKYHLFTELVVHDNGKFASQVLEKLPNGTILAGPDKGSREKIQRVAEANGVDWVCADKIRDSATGNITGLSLDESVDLTGKNILVLDDLIDAGGSFTHLAKLLKSRGANQLFLAVSHGIFSKGYDCVYEHYQKIFITDSFRPKDDYPLKFQQDGVLEIYDVLSETF